MLMQLFDEHGAEVWAYPKAEAKTSRLVGLGVTLALVVGSLGLYAAARQSKATREVEAPAPQPTAHVAPAPTTSVGTKPPRPTMQSRLWLPSTDEETEEVLDAARVAVVLFEDPEEQVRATWRRVWGGPYPGAIDAGHHSSVIRAIATAKIAVLCAMREFNEETGVFEELAPKIRRIRKASLAKCPRSHGVEPEVESEPMPTHPPVVEPEPELEPEPGVSEVPCPGHFYEVCEGQELTGPAGIATGALLMAGLEAGCAQGWSQEETEARATELAHHPQAQAIYVKLLADCEQNADKLEPLRPGTQLWLPPLPRGALLGPAAT